MSVFTRLWRSGHSALFAACAGDPWGATIKIDYDGSRMILERAVNGTHLAAYAYGPLGPAARIQLDTPDGQPCLNYLLADGQGNTVAALQASSGAVSGQRYDAFGVPTTRIALSGCLRMQPEPPAPPRGTRSATGTAGYHGQEGYQTHLTDPDRVGGLANADVRHPDYDATHAAGYQDRSTGILLLGARDYDPEIGRFLEPDPVSVDPTPATWGQNNRWAYCANDPVNASDPSGNATAFDSPFGLAFALGAFLGALYAAWALGDLKLPTRILRGLLGALVFTKKVRNWIGAFVKSCMVKPTPWEAMHGYGRSPASELLGLGIALEAGYVYGMLSYTMWSLFEGVWVG